MYLKKRKSLFPKIILIVIILALVAVGLYNIPPIHEKLAWRLDNLVVSIRYLINPPEKVAFHPGGATAATATTGAPAATSTPIPPTQTPLPTDLATAILTTTPPPSSVILQNVTYVDQMARYNYCGPANLAMALEYWGWKGEPDLGQYAIRDQVALVIKPGENDQSKNFVERGNTDVNVMPYEMVDYVNEKTNLRALYRWGGDAEIIKRLIAAGFPPITEKGLYEPLLPDYSIQWGGHYSFTTGYDDASREFIWQDSYLPKANSVGHNARSPYAEYMANWRAFNYVFIVVYPPDREAELMQALGPWADEYWAAQHSLEIANQEIASHTLSGNDLFFAMFNRVTALINLQNPDYGPAGAAFDEANAYYNDVLVPTKDRKIPYRIMWYETAPYSAYYNSGRYQDVIDLANINLNDRITKPRSLEESWFWRARAEYALGSYDQAIADMRTALYYHPNFPPALDMLSLWGVSP
jgi:tetratricopeptide (TPR) repeat protein